MSQEPTFPAGAMTGGTETVRVQPAPAAPRPDNDDAADDAAPAAPDGEAASAGGAAKTNIWPAAGVAIGIGSAAIAAALLYRSRRP